MFEPDDFVDRCNAALAEHQPMLAIKDLLDEALTAPGEIAEALGQEPGVHLLHRSDVLTVVQVLIPPGMPRTLPHDHRMWALVGVYAGQEDNTFFRRDGAGLVDSGGRSIVASASIALGDDTIHAIQNPSGHETLAAIHVYGGDLVGTPRSMWTEPGYVEAPYDDVKVLGSRITT